MRNLPLRTIVATLHAAAALLAITGTARAEWAPTHKVEFVIPFGPGGGADILARTLIRAIEEEKLVPVPIVPVNRGGGGTAVGVSYVKTSFDGNPNVLVLINPQTQLTPMQVAGAAGWRDLTPLTNIMVDDYTFVTKDGAAVCRRGRVHRGCARQAARHAQRRLGRHGRRSGDRLARARGRREAERDPLQQRGRGADRRARRPHRRGCRQPARVPAVYPERHGAPARHHARDQARGAATRCRP